jgi:UDP-N-acetylglucosamine 2-epimerase
LSKTICKNIRLLSQWARFDVRQDFLLIVQHPAGATADQEKIFMEQTLQGCRRKDLPAIVLYPNCDPGFSGILPISKRLCKKYGWTMIQNMPRPIYLGLLSRARILVGNSSSGIIEAGYLNVDVINVGHRQSGREHGENVRNVNYGQRNIARTIDSILDQSRYKRNKCTVYGDGKSSRKIAAILAKVKIDQPFWQKKITY